MRYCECGCGQLVKNRFVSGHNVRIFNSMKRPEVASKVNVNRIDKTYEQIYGEDRAKRIKGVQSKLGLVRWKDMNFKKMMVESLRGRTWELSEEIRREYRKLKKKVMNRVEIKEKCSKSKIEFYKTKRGKKCRQKRSKDITNLYLRGGFNYKGGYFYSKKNDKNLWYRSPEELIAYQILESLVNVVKYEVEVVRIPYFWNGGVHRYIVDLLVYYDDGSKQLIEIKMKWAIEKDERTKLKIEAGKEYAEQNGMRFSVWTEEELYRRNK